MASPWVVLALALLAAAGALGFDLYTQHGAMGTQERLRLAHQAEVIDVNLSRQLQVTSNALDSMRSDLTRMLAQAQPSSLISRYLQTIAAGMTGVRTLVVIDADGNAIASNQKELIGSSYRASERYQTMHERGDPELLYISPPFTGALGFYTITLGKIMLDEHGKVAGYVLAGLDPEYFSILLKSTVYASDMRVGLVHGDGKAIYRVPDPEGVIGMDVGSMPDSFTARHLRSGQESNILTGVTASTGEHRLMALRTVRPTSSRADKPLVILVGREMRAIYAYWRRDLMVRAILLVVIALGAILGLLFYQRRKKALERTLADEGAARSKAEQKLRDQETEQTRTEEKLRDSEARFHKLFEDMRQAVILLEDGRCIAANRTALAMLRVNQLEQLIGKTALDFSPPFQPDGRPSAEKVAEMVWIATELGSNVFEWEHVRANGEPFQARVQLTVIRPGNKSLLHAVLYDITAQKLPRQDVEFLAFHDALTGLPNRILSREQLQRAVQEAARDNSRLAVLHIGLHQLRSINDAYGQTVGDHLLVSVAMRLGNCLRAEDILCRRSGDGFMAVFPRVLSYQQVSDLCDTILARCKRPFGVGGLQLSTHLSIGVAFYPKDGADCDTLMQNADTALRQARKAGPDSCYFYEPQMSAGMERFVQTREALRQALEREEFELHYLARVDLQSKRVVGVEATIRWRQSGRTLALSPEVVTVAEESGLILQLGRWALHTACRQAAAWRQAGQAGLTVSVALSAVQYRGARVERDVKAALDDSGLDPAGLELVLVESVLRQHDEEALAMLGRWTARGIRLCIDDFGSCYTHLAYLKRLQAGKIRLDLSSFSQLETEGEQRAIVQAMLQGAHDLNIRTAAKGVIDAAMADRLREMGCDEAQGYLLPVALPADEFGCRLATLDAQ